MTSKAVTLTVGSCLCIIISGFKTGVLWSPSRSITNPAWFDYRPTLYVFDFTLEILILAVYTSSRVDEMFYVPNGSSKRRSFAIKDQQISSEFGNKRAQESGVNGACT